MTYRQVSECDAEIITQYPEPGSYVSVPDFYAGKSIFLTGVTGFLGKVFLEKLLFSCEDIETIYILIREKKGKTPLQRIEELFDKPLFSRLKEKDPQCKKKVIPIIGELSEPGLGISKANEETLLDKVSVVFHAAANVQFDKELKEIINTNVCGTKYVLQLCQRMKNIKAFVHVSTAYCHTDQTVLEERVYPPPAELSEVLKFLQQPQHDNKKQIKEFFKEQPNSYTFAKALAETYIAENCGHVPTIIIRPSIISSSLKEPLPGWLDTWNGATGLITASYNGANRVLLGEGSNILDLIPVDFVANLAIVAATRCTSPLKVYNCCSSGCNPLTLKQLISHMNHYGCDKNVSIIFTNNKPSMFTFTFLLQTTPSFTADMFLRATGKSPKYMKIQSKLTLAQKALSYFTSHSWVMKADNSRKLYASLSIQDRQTFPCDPTDIDWKQYITIYLEGINQFLMKNYT
ncbi:putative fatty acyl-CoA reductase CG5065 isoform X1 [Spodoptera frugiperda]|uniref:Fatty acyl-CoA reductase n=1 Tax=Spodoptera frugiperda TaxID=7108 RepID=A0A9R0EB61_SPOFR|nr:putative fatty acyl-CoA reductase CG5065 isoform X1 [Spodoptera frugiperda]